ncbi:MAG TPA: hypothetical protein VMM13_18015 [Euzebya sp.]|nr:hypothetical protein [Euzebya sp.]
MTDSSSRRRLGRLTAAVAVLVIVVLAARTTDDAAVTDVLAIPEPGSVRADRLDNGTPVFTVQAPSTTPDGAMTIDVIQAFTTEVEGPITGLVGWCAAAQQFTQPHLGPLYDVRGRRLPSSTEGRVPAAQLFDDHTALDDLVQREVTRIDGRDQAEDPIIVGGIQLLQDFQVAQRPAMSPAVPPTRCRLPDQPFVDGADGPSEPSAGTDASSGARRPRLLDHGFLAGPVDPGATGWQITTGWLLVQPDGQTIWCDEPPDRDGNKCPRPRADIAVGFSFDARQTGGIATVIGSPLAVRLHDGVVRRAAVLPASTWHGSSLRGTEVLRGVGLALEEVGTQGTERRLALAGARYAQEEGGACLRRWPVRSPGGTVNLPVTADTILRGLADRQEVVVDAVTCRALLVSDIGG